MAYISFQPSDNFNTVLFVGNTGGVPTTVTGVGFQPDFCWFKNVSVTNDFWLFDSVRGVEKYIECNNGQLETTDVQGLQSFNADGFTVGDANPINQNTKDIVSWNWKAGTTTGIAGSPSITPSSYSFNQTAGFSIIAYTGTGSAATLPHGLGAAPTMMIIKSRTVTTDWGVYHQYCNAVPEDYTMILNTTAQAADNNVAWNDTAPTSTLFSVAAGDTNATSKTHVAYCFTDIKGYSKFGKYTGTGSAVDGPFIYTGFRPAFVMIKSFSGTSQDWKIIDDKRSTYNVTAASIAANDTAAEVTSYNICDFTANGFKIRSDRNEYNGATSYDYIYAAFAESPFVNSEGVPTNAR